MDWMTDFDVWIVNNAAYPGFFILFLIAAAVTLVIQIGPAIVGHIWKKPTYDEFQSEFNNLSQDRADLWEILDRVYGSHENKLDEVSWGFRTLVDLSLTPENFPDRKSDKAIGVYAAEICNVLENESRQLWRFLDEVYGEAVRYRWIPDGTKGFKSNLKQEDRKTLYRCRRNLSKFWDKWGEKILGKPIELRPKRVEGRLNEQARLFKLLTYMELVQAQSEQTLGPGKIWLFKLAQRQNSARGDSKIPDENEAQGIAEA